MVNDDGRESFWLEINDRRDKIFTVYQGVVVRFSPKHDDNYLVYIRVLDGKSRCRQFVDSPSLPMAFLGKMPVGGKWPFEYQVFA